MALFIPEWVRSSGRQVHLKRALAGLDDEHIVRRPVRPGACPADLFVQHPGRGWLAVAVDETPFAALDPAQLFPDERQARFEQRLAALQALAMADGRAQEQLEFLVLMWHCANPEVRVLSRVYTARYGVRFIARERFVPLAPRLVSGLLAPLSVDQEQSLLGRWFPESEVPAGWTTRRFFRRDNRARLGRFFLDPGQEWATKLDLELPDEPARAAKDFSVRLVNGVAGSGKTLIALNRALLLAELLPSKRLLLLIHNTPVVADLEDRLVRQRGGLPPNLEVSTFFRWAFRQWRLVFGRAPRMPGHPREVPDLLAGVRQRAAPGLSLTDEQLLGEVDFINDSLIVDEARYLEASRAGRGFALRPGEREQIWAVYQALADQLAHKGLRLWSSLAHDLCGAGDRLSSLDRYDHVLVDEAQFFAPSWFQLVKLALGREGQLFLCADPNQGFLQSRLSWKRVGLDVAGRTQKLRRSYRTTQAILEAADGVLEPLGAQDAEDFLRPDFGGMETGARPMLVYAATPQDAVDRLVNELGAWLGPGTVPLGAALVIYGPGVNKAALYGQLAQRFGSRRVWWFNEKDQKRRPPGGFGQDCLRMAYLDTATGLEAATVFLIGMEPLFREPAAPGLSPAEQAKRREENARKLYMAMTRAGQRLVLLASQPLPPALERLFDQAEHVAAN